MRMKFTFFSVLVFFSMVFASSQMVSFTNSVNTVQYSNPSLQSMYSGGYSPFWTGIGDSFDESMCNDGTDFVLAIPPLGCEPMVVRSDLLAEQNVPVMCQLASVRVNPLIRVSAIKSIGFTGQMPSEVAGVSFYPARAGIRSYNTLLGDPLYNNVGYVVIILKKNPNEKNMSKFVSGNLTARITYDAERAYGVGNAVLYLEGEDTNGNIISNNSATFWNGLGYVKLLSADSKSARLGVYTREGRLVREVVLKEGETSSKIYMPGFYCQASLRIKLSEFTTPEDSALLNIDGESIWVRRGSQILNGRCTVTGLEVYTGDTGKVVLNCQSAGKIELSLLGGYSANLSLDNVEKSYNVSNFVLKGNISKGSELNWYVGFSGLVGKQTEGDKEGVVVLLGSTKEIKPEVYSNVAQAIKKIEDAEMTKGDSRNVVSAIESGLSVSGYTKDVSLVILKNDQQEVKFTRNSKEVTLVYNGLIGAKESTETKAEEGKTEEDTKTEEVANYLNEADKAVKDLLRDYPQVKGDLNRFGEIALLEQINLVEKVDSASKLSLMETFLEKYPDSIYAGLVNEMIYQEKVFDSKNAQKIFEINGNYHSIVLSRVQVSDSQKKKASIYARGNSLGQLSEGDEVNLTRGEASERIKVVKIYPNKIDAEVLVKSKEGEFVKEGSIFTMRVDEPLKKKIKEDEYLLEVSDIQVQTVAKVELLVDANNKNTEANFSYKIGIEQRLIQLNPNKSSEKAQKLNETIKRLEDKNNKLGELIKGWKAACLVTGIGLNVKNMITGSSGNALARQEVMKSWRSFCEADKTTTSFGTPRSLDACYNEYSDEIDNDVKKYSAAVQKINDQISKEPNITKFKEGLKNENIEGLEGGASLTTNHLRTWDEIRAYLLYEALKTPGFVSPGLQNTTKVQRNTKLQYLVGLKADMDANKEASSLGLNFGRDPEEIKDREVRSWSGEHLNTIIGVDLSGIDGNPAVAGERLLVGERENFFVLILDKIPTASERARVVSVYNVTGNKVSDVKSGDEFEKLKNYVYQLSDCDNKISSPTVTYYESGNMKGLTAMVPFDAQKGWYARVSSSVGGLLSSEAKGYSSSAVPETFTICNVGSDGIQGQDDSCLTSSINQNFGEKREYVNVAGCLLKPSELDVLMKDAQDAIRQANQKYSIKGNIEIKVGSRERLIARRGSPQGQDGPIEQCQDFMSPGDCQLMFNVCDPVMCPVSRCNFGGKYPVTNVIQSGIFGSLVLCLPNFKPLGGDVYVPVCLTGVHAGIDAYISVLKAHRDCLLENAKTGRYVGSCDYVTAIYKCNLFWNNIAPFASNIIPNLFSFISTGRTQKAGGGEYLTFQKAWDNMESSLDYFKNTYGSTSFTAFKLGNTEEFGTEVCNAFVGTSFPTTAEGLDKMLQPESPYQIYAEFQEVAHTDATVPPTSQYKVFAHIYAGKDQGVSYSVYLKSPPSSSYYAGIPYLGVPEGTGYVSKGDQRQISKDFTAPSGYKELCVSINGKEHCNFGPVTTDFGISKLTDSYVEKQAAQTEIKTEKECIQGTSGVVGFTSINPQAAVTNVVDPRIDLKGIVRVCSSVNPGEGTSQAVNWERAGYCGDQNVVCWLDKSSVSEATGQILDVAGTIAQAEKSLDIINTGGTLNEAQSIERLVKIKNWIVAWTNAPTANQINQVRSNITELEQKGFSNRYQAEGNYWRFKLYEQVVRLNKGLDVNVVKVDVPSESSSLVNTQEAENPTTLKDLQRGVSVSYQGKEYVVDANTLASGKQTVKLLPKNSNDKTEYVVGASTDKLEDKGLSISS